MYKIWFGKGLTMAKIAKLIAQREQEYIEATDLIFMALDHVLEGIIEYVGQSPEDFSWDGVSISRDLVIINARTAIMDDVATVLNKKTGEVMEMPTVNANGERLQRSLTIGIPIEIAEDGTAKDIIEFLREMDAENHNEELIEEQETISKDQDKSELPEYEDWENKKYVYNERTIH